MAPESFGSARADLLKKHLQAQLNVEFFTIPFYLTAVYSFTNAAMSYAGPKGDYPLYNLQQSALSVAVQEMYHLQEACNMANAYGLTPEIAATARNFTPGGPIVVPHLDPSGGPLTATLGNLAEELDAMVAVEKPDANPTFPPPNDQVMYPAISDLYHATLTLVAEYMNQYRLMPIELDPHFTPNRNQVAFGAFATRYRYNKIAHREDFAQAANAIADQGEGREVIPKIKGLFQSGDGCDIAAPYLPATGSRFSKYDGTTHYCRFEAIQQALNGTDWVKALGGQPVFYTASGVASPDLPSWAPSYTVCQNSLNLIWSFFTDTMMKGFADGSLSEQSGGTLVDFGSAMISFKYTIPLIWQHGYCPAFEYQPNVTAEQAQAAMDQVDPLCLYHWDAATAKVRASFQKNACQGLNACKGQGWGGIATEKGNGACATADFHSCQGGNNCSYQGGCGFLSSENKTLLPGSEQWIPRENSGKGSGGCQTPIAALQVFDSGADISDVQPAEAQTRLNALKGTKVWDEARKLFGQAYKIDPLPPPTSATVGDVTYDGTKRRAAVAASSKS